ncbi:MAG TPA: right-handed parallel beta-helix repeat-containing protein, partial [Kineosporiaceae bacterium]|nr:right-handed parallel beta-helix repeat-containing protein [Kineosporiaceae bacterium]
ARRILFRAHPGERVVLDASRLAGRVAVGVGGRYVDVQGFEISGPAQVGISVWGGAHVRVVGNRLHGQTSAGIFTGFSSAGTVKDVDVSGNTVWDEATSNRAHTEGGGWGQGVTVGNETEDVRVTANTIYHSHGEGLGVGGVRAVVDGNVLYDNWSAGIYVDQGTRDTISHNLVYATGDRAWNRFGMPSTSIQIANEGRARPELLTGLKIHDNVLVGGRSGIGYWSSYGVGGGLRNSVIEHNTVYGSASEDLLVQPDAGHTGTTVTANVFVRHGAGRLADVPASGGISFAGNCWSAAPPARVAGRGDVVAVPRFVRAGGTTLGDYALAPGSPCAGLGARR